MFYYLAVSSSLLIFIASGIVLALGDWRKVQLKFGATILAFCTSLWLAWNSLINVGTTHCAATQVVCLQWELFYIGRQIAMFMFIIAFGRDAIHFKKKDRRVTPKERVANV